MKIKRLFIKNIRSYKEQEIEFPEGSLLLAGDIGAGKTSLLLAIEYALFGLQPGQKGLALLRNDSKEGEVKLELEVKENQILIERRLKRTERGVSNEYAAITINGEKEEASITEIKTRILQILGYPQEFIKKNNLLYRYTVFTPQEQMKQIISEDAETRLNIIRNIFGVDKYKRIRENLIITLSSIKEKIRLLQGETKYLDEEKQNLEQKKEQIIQLELSLDKISSGLKEKIKKRQKIEKEVTELEERIREKQNLEKAIEKSSILMKFKSENLFSLKNEIEELRNSILKETQDFNKEDYGYLIEEIKKNKEKINFFNSKYIDYSSEISALHQQQESNTKKRERIFKIDICPTCLQDVPEIHKHNILNEVEFSMSQIKNRTSLLEQEKKSILDLTEREKLRLDGLEQQKQNLDIVKSKQSYLENSKIKLQNLENLKENLIKDISLMETNIRGLKQEVISFFKYDKQHKTNQLLLKMVQIEERDSEIALAEIKKETELTKKEKSRLMENLNKKQQSKQKLDGLLELNDWLSTKFISLIEFIERSILINLRAEFSKLFGKWFNMLVSQDSLQVQLDESFSPIIIQGDIEMEYGFLSGGERTAVALAYRLALNQTINSVLSKIQTRDLVVLDEPTEGFSETQIDKMRDVLLELKINQLIIVSHEQKIEGFVDNVIKIRKFGDISSLN